MKVRGAEDRNMLFLEDEWMGKFFSSPLRLALGLSLAGMFLVLASYGVGVAHVVRTCDVGFVERPNWGAMFVFVLPAIFYLASDLLAQIEPTSRSLTQDSVKVVIPRVDSVQTSETSHAGSDFESELGTAIARKTNLVLWISALSSIGVTSVVFYFLFFDPNGIPEDWIMPGEIQLRKWKFIIFDCFAFLAQGFYVFIGVYWAGKMALFLETFWKLTSGRGSKFRLDFMIYDPLRRLGLAPIGSLLTKFGTIALIFDAYIGLYSMQSQADIRKMCLWDYMKETVNSKNTAIQILGLGNPPRLIEFTGAGVVALVVLSVLLWCTYISIPIFCTRPTLRRMAHSTWVRKARELDAAVKGGDRDVSEALGAEFEALSSATYWPNGKAIGWGMCFGLLVIPILALYPPALGYGLASGLLVGALKSLKA
jgi:hypothetical protein